MPTADDQQIVQSLQLMLSEKTTGLRVHSESPAVSRLLVRLRVALGPLSRPSDPTALRWVAQLAKDADEIAGKGGLPKDACGGGAARADTVQREFAAFWVKVAKFVGEVWGGEVSPAWLRESVAADEFFDRALAADRAHLRSLLEQYLAELRCLRREVSPYRPDPIADLCRELGVADPDSHP